MISKQFKTLQHFFFYNLALIILLPGIYGQVEPESWENYPIWENTTKYSKIYVVNPKHENACDTNRGTENRPLVTIGEAISKVKPGEKILIHEGTYHEIIRPARGGVSPDKMIGIEGAEGEKIIIKGSYIIGNTWAKEIESRKAAQSVSVIKSRSQKLWITQLNDTLFTQNYYPFGKEYKPVQSNPGIIQGFSTIYNGMIYQDSKRMAQLEKYGDLIHIPGSFWVDNDGKTIHIHPFNDKNPNESQFEVVVFPSLFKPDSLNLGYIEVKGLIFEHCANDFPGPGSGAIHTRGGHHWIFRNNIIREINSIGIEIDKPVNQQFTSSDFNSVDQNGLESGYINLINNRIYGCGISGIWCISDFGVLKNNEVFDCGWQEIEQYGESAGIKVMQSKNCLISNNFIHHILGGTGIWLQKECAQSRLTRNIIYNISSFHGALTIEQTSKENLIDNNLVWNVDGTGINGQNSDNQYYYHNLIANTSGAPVKILSVKNKGIDSIQYAAVRNKISNNIFYNFGDKMDISGLSNTVSNNLFVLSTDIGAIELKKWQARMVNKQGALLRADAGFNPKTLMFKWNSRFEVQPVPSVPIVKTDILNEKRTEPSTIPGPLQTLPRNSDYFVSLTVERE